MPPITLYKWKNEYLIDNDIRDIYSLKIFVNIFVADSYIKLVDKDFSKLKIVIETYIKLIYRSFATINSCPLKKLNSYV